MRQTQLFSTLRIVILAGCSVSITVCTGCGGGSSASTGKNSSATTNPSPTLSTLSPDSADAAGPNFTLTAIGVNFISSSTIQWNGYSLATAYISSTELQTVIDAADIATAGVGSASVTVSNPSPGGGASQPIVFTINPPLTVTGMVPSSWPAGSPAFSVTVYGSGFASNSAIEWNNSSRVTTYVSSTELQATIEPSDVATTGTAQVTVVTPAPGGGTSGPLQFTITNGGYTFIAVNQAASDLVWDPIHQVIYLSVPNDAAGNGNSIAVLDPLTGAILSTQFAGSGPDPLAISDDGSYLYVGLDNQASLQRFVLPGLTPDINISLGASSFGAYHALYIASAPGAPHTVAVSFIDSDGSYGSISIYDDSTPRTLPPAGFNGSFYVDSLQWGTDVTTIFAHYTEGDLYTFTVGSSGAMLNQDYSNAFSGNAKIHFDTGTGLVYGDDGRVVSSSTGLPTGRFPDSGLVVPDSTLNMAFFTPLPASPNGISIQSFDLSHFTQLSSIVVPNSTGPNATGVPIRLIRWGQNGLAFNTTAGQVFLIQGAFVGSATNASNSTRDSRSIRQSENEPKP